MTFVVLRETEQFVFSLKDSYNSTSPRGSPGVLVQTSEGSVRIPDRVRRPDETLRRYDSGHLRLGNQVCWQRPVAYSGDPGGGVVYLRYTTDEETQ